VKFGIDLEIDKSKYISFFKKLFFGLGNIYNGALDFLSFFYAIFLTDVVNLSPVYGSIVFFVSIVWEALFVPFVGQLSDNTKSRLGRRRLYFLIGIVPVFITFFLLWYPPVLNTVLAKFIYVLITSILFRSVFNLVMIPYDAMRAQITRDYNDRNILNIFCLGFSVLSTLLILVVPMYMTGVLNSQRTVFFNMAVIFGSIFSMVWVGVFLSTKDSDEPVVKKRRTRVFKGFFQPLRIKSFRILTIMYIVVSVGLSIMSLLYLYYMKYYMGVNVTVRSATVIIPFALAVIAQAGIIPFMLKLSRLQSKSLGYILSGIIWCGGGYLLFILPPNSSKIMLGICVTLLGIGISGTLLMLNSMRGDVTDVGEFYFGEKREGSISGLMLFLRKISMAIAQSLTLLALGLAGYVKPVLTDVGGILKAVEQPQPEMVLFVIRFFISIIPVALVTWGIINAVKYPVSCRIHNKLIKFLKEKNEAEKIDELAKEDLENKLIKPGKRERFEFILRVWRGFYHEFNVKGTEKVIRSKPAVFVGNHAGTFGPVIIQIFFPFKLRPWVVSYVTSKEKCEEHLLNVFFKENLIIKAPWNKILAKIMANLCSWVMGSKAAQAIPVYRSDRMVIQTFRKSVEALEENYNIMLFPENSNTEFSENIRDFYTGFVTIAKKYYKETGKEVLFYPVYIDKDKHNVTIGDSTRYDSSKDFKEERDRIAHYLRDYIDNLANIQKQE
jgi:oligogalacturonide transporter